MKDDSLRSAPPRPPFAFIIVNRCCSTCWRNRHPSFSAAEARWSDFVGGDAAEKGARSYGLFPQPVGALMQFLFCPPGCRAGAVPDRFRAAGPPSYSNFPGSFSFTSVIGRPWRRPPQLAVLSAAVESPASTRRAIRPRMRWWLTSPRPRQRPRALRPAGARVSGSAPFVLGPALRRLRRARGFESPACRFWIAGRGLSLCQTRFYGPSLVWPESPAARPACRRFAWRAPIRSAPLPLLLTFPQVGADRAGTVHFFRQFRPCRAAKHRRAPT